MIKDGIMYQIVQYFSYPTANCSYFGRSMIRDTLDQVVFLFTFLLKFTVHSSLSSGFPVLDLTELIETLIHLKVRTTNH